MGKTLRLTWCNYQKHQFCGIAVALHKRYCSLKSTDRGENIYFVVGQTYSVELVKGSFSCSWAFLDWMRSAEEKQLCGYATCKREQLRATLLSKCNFSIHHRETQGFPMLLWPFFSHTTRVLTEVLWLHFYTYRKDVWKPICCVLKLLQKKSARIMSPEQEEKSQK